MDCGLIVVADDDAGARALLVEVLRAGGYRTVEAEGGVAALEAASGEAPDLLVLDVVMPDLSGYEVVRRLRGGEGPGGLPIVFVSGERTEPLDRTTGLLLGGDDYVVKPFEPDELLARVHSLLRRARSAGASSPLTSREDEVLRLLAEGLGDAAIARRLVISEKTVGAHLSRIYGKLGVGNRAAAVGHAYRTGLLRAE